MRRGKAPYIPKEVLLRVVAEQDGPNVLRDRAILLFSHYLGLRAKELSMLTVGDVFDPELGIKETVRLLPRITKGNVFREAFLVKEEVREALRKYLVTRSLRRLDAPLFLSQKGCAFSANTMQRLLHNLYAKADVVASSHSGRRSFATHLIENGTDIYTIKEMMGHTSITTTQEYFATNPMRLKRAAAALN